MPTPSARSEIARDLCEDASVASRPAVGRIATAGVPVVQGAIDAAGADDVAQGVGAIGARALEIRGIVVDAVETEARVVPIAREDARTGRDECVR